MKKFSCFTLAVSLSSIKAQSQRLPPQTVVSVHSSLVHKPLYLDSIQVVDVAGLAVLGNNGSFRTPSATFNPTNATTPFFQVWDTSFLDILGPNASVRVIADHDVGEFPSAHEALIWDPSTDQIFFVSSTGTPGGDHPDNNQVSVISLKDVKGPGPQNINFTKVPITPELQMVNGGTPLGRNLLFATNGFGTSPSRLELVNPRPPFNSTTILDNFRGRQFNSMNDLKVHPTSGAVFFTDPTYGYGFLLGFKPSPTLPNQVYRFDPKTGAVRVATDEVDECNGIAFSPDGKIAYIADSGAAGLSFDPTHPATIYAFDVDPQTQQFRNRRVLAYIDTGAPDGLQVDSKGNVYASTADGVQVYDPTGVLLGKIFIGTTSANNIFAGPGRLVILALSQIFLVEFAAAPSLIELQV
ncbi:hypothetical protein M422DRAFT_174152 [Sphaerobolus stellatus SS14]|uniref:Unplaced genomic scaffold SPHSTscaffold_71, whole genome shotgun sequence n=1 Tax=Sphaerobolus stellatus (strain SS14) TaxID=990650 RepID=A0A0C9VQI9_SPHS4|nr:hypothetical protein M422DRAFT_174152 [Sphaerobolus stellatus SS14]